MKPASVIPVPTERQEGCMVGLSTELRWAIKFWHVLSTLPPLTGLVMRAVVGHQAQGYQETRHVQGPGVRGRGRDGAGRSDQE